MSHSTPSADQITRRAFMALSGAGIMALSIPRLAPAQPDSLEVFPADLVDDLVALGETLVPEDVTPGMSREEVLGWLEHTLGRDEEAPIWIERSMPTLAAGAAAVTATDRRFSSLTPEERHAALVHLLDTPGAARESEWHRRVVRPMMSWFFNTPRGHTVVGYQSYTGSSLAGDITSYSGPGQMPGESGVT